MTTASNHRFPTAPRPEPVGPLRVSTYDRVSSLVVALIIFVGFFVVILFLMWLTTVMSFSQVAVPVMLVDEPAGRGEHAQGYERDLEEPGLDEVDELIEPQLDQQLEAVTDIVTSQAAALDAMRTDAAATGRGRGMGDSRQAGPLDEGNAVPRWQRWQVQFSATGIQSYAKQLDYFGIELAAAGGGKPLVDYVSRLSQSRPRHRTGRGDQEQRLYMTWRSGALQQFDRQLLARADVKVEGRILLQFYPASVENQLAGLEMQRARGRSVDEILKTFFGVRRSGSKYEFYVMDQQYRPSPR